MADGGSPTYQGVGRGRGRARQPAVPNGQVIASKRTLGQSYGRSDFSVPPGPLIVEAQEMGVNHIQVSEGVSALPRGVPIMRSADGLNEHADATKSEITSILTSEYVTMVRRLETLDAIHAEKSSLMIKLEQATARAASLEAENYQLRSTLKESARLDEELRPRVVTLLQHNLTEPDEGMSKNASAIGSKEKSEFLYEESSLEMPSQGDGNSNQQLRRENEILRRQVQSLQRQRDSDRREANLKFNRLRQEKDQLQNQFFLIDSHLVRESNLRKALEDELERHFLCKNRMGS